MVGRQDGNRLQEGQTPGKLFLAGWRGNRAGAAIVGTTTGSLLPKEDTLGTASTHEVTSLLLAWRQGHEAALEKLIPLVHQELRRLAHLYMTGQRSDHTLQTSALVNEAYLRLVGYEQVRWQDRAHFIGVSAQLMRRVLVDSARSRGSRKRGGGDYRVSLDEGLIRAPEREEDLIALDHALKELTELDERKSKVVELRFFGGLSVKETAEVLSVSSGTVKRDWRLAKLWLLGKLETPHEA